MEMNTRIQVEHPITEMAANIDLVAWQLRIAMGEQLRLEEKDIEPRGHAIECRITARIPARDFSPSVGTVTTYVAPGGPGVRVDSHLFSGYQVPPFYDSLLAKIAVWGKDRNEAIERMERALRETIIDGVTNITPLHRTILADEGFRRGRDSHRVCGRFPLASHHLVAGAQEDATVQCYPGRSTSTSRGIRGGGSLALVAPPRGSRDRGKPPAGIASSAMPDGIRPVFSRCRSSTRPT